MQKGQPLEEDGEEEEEDIKEEDKMGKRRGGWKVGK